MMFVLFPTRRHRVGYPVRYQLNSNLNSAILQQIFYNYYFFFSDLNVIILCNRTNLFFNSLNACYFINLQEDMKLYYVMTDIMISKHLKLHFNCDFKF